MNMKMECCAHKAARALFASALAAGLMIPSGAALAKSSNTDVDDASFTLTGIASGDVVHAYQVFDTDIDANNNLTYTMKVTGLPDAYDTVEEISAATNGRDVADAIAAQVVATSSKKADDVTAGSDGKATLALDSGYWLVTVTSNSGDTKVYQTLLVDATPDVSDGVYVTRAIKGATAKSEPVPPPTKQIVDPDGNAGQSTDRYSVGDTAKFTISGTVPSYPADATRAVYSITDVPDKGLEVDTTSFVVKSGDKILAAGADYTLTANADGTYTVAFSKSFILANGSKSVTIDYSAQVTKIDLASGKVGNKVYGTFTPNPYEEKDVDTDKTDPWDQTYGFEFKKLAAPDNAPLAGAEFTVTDASGSPVTYIDASGAVHTNGVVTSDANGWVYVNGLEAGTYKVSETKVPSGFQKIGDFSVTLSADTAKSDASSTGGVTELNFNYAGEKTDPKVGELPSTGDVGTVALTAGGILLVAGGSAAIIRLRRRNDER